MYICSIINFKYMKLSIIVPVYNASPFLRRCVNSLLAQGLKEGEYEIILINDGSKDDSLDICKEYLQQHPSVVKVFTHENQGVSVTRNKGIREASGEYICFVDADDYLIPGGYRYLIDNFLEGHIDILSFWALTLDKKTKANYVENNDVTGKICYDILGRDFLKDRVQTFIWNSFYRREFLLSHQLYFNTNMNIGEDCLFNINVYMNNPFVRMVSSRLYRYVLQENSAIHQRNYPAMRRAINSYLLLFSEIQQYVEINRDNIELCRGLRNIIKQQYVPFLSRVLSSDYSVSEMKSLKSNLRSKGILPFEMTDFKSLMINMFFKTYFFIRLYQWGYQRIFIPYVLPHLSRN